MILKELKILFTAIMFYTRIPVPKSTGYSNEMLNKATRYFPFIGWIVGGIGAFFVWFLGAYLPQEVTIIATLILMILVTGAFHEDAFADFCDGFGGGYTKEKILAIMKDSHVGVYATVGLVLLLLAKYTLLTNIAFNQVAILIFVAHAFSRLLPVFLIFSSNYVSAKQTAKAKPVENKGSVKTLVVAILFGILPLILINIKYLIPIISTQILTFLYFRYYVHKQIKGYTGDVLGALQQISELAFYLVYLCSITVL